MFTLAFFQVILLLGAILALTVGVARFVAWVESSPDTQNEMSGWEYFRTLLGISLGIGAYVFVVSLAQGFLPMNPSKLPPPTLAQAGHLAVAVATHTNWQPWAPEKLISAFTLFFGVGLGNLAIGGVGIAAWRAFTRALGRKAIGNAWEGWTHGLVILLPIQLILAGILWGQGVDFFPAVFSAGSLASGAGTNWIGSGFASGYQNPTIFSDFCSIAVLMGLPLGFLLATGILTNRVQLIGRLSLAILVYVGMATAITNFYNPNTLDNPRWALSQSLWLNTTAGSANGTLNVAPENFHPAGLLTAFLTLLGGIPFPPSLGIGVGILMMFLVVTIYLACLMVGRSPDFLGFRIKLPEVAAVAAGILGPQIVVLTAVAMIILTPEGIELLRTAGAHGMSALLWMLGSCAQNNGSAYSLTLTMPTFVNASIVVMLLGRIFTLGSVVALGTLLARQRNEIPAPAAVDVQGAVMVSFWTMVIVVGAVLTMLPLMFMGPILEVCR